MYRTCTRWTDFSFFCLLQSSGRALDKPGRKKRVGVNKEFFRQIGKILPTLFPSLFCRETGLLALHTGCLLGRTAASIWLANMDGRIVRALITAQGRKFVRLLCIWLAASVPISFINASIKFLKQALALSFRTRLTKLAHEEYCSGLTYYQLQQLDSRLLNPDQCITADISKFCSSLANLYSDLAKPSLDVAIYNYQLSRNVGGLGFAAVSMLFVTGTGALRLFTPAFGVLTGEQQALEGKFRFYHSRVTTNAEEIAFYGGAETEKSYLNVAYDELKRHTLRLNLAKLSFGTAENFVVKYFWGALGFLVCALPVFTPFGRIDRPSGLAASDDMGDRTQSFFTNRRILMNTSDAWGRIMGSWRKVNELTGYTARVAEMFDVFEDMPRQRFSRNFQASVPGEGAGTAVVKPFHGTGKVVDCEQIEVEGLKLVNPTGDVLAENMSFTCPRGAHVFISGPNGCGKSSLFRVIGGLWPVVEGVVRKPLSASALFYIPQRPYLSLGTLRDQITYPLKLEQVRARGVSDEDLLRIMDIVQLRNIIDNYGGFDAQRNWKDSLSGGEKQRVAMARLFFHKPQYAILDECTSACSLDCEGAIYTEAKKQGISLITVSHRHTLWKFHDWLLTLDGAGGWTFGPMDQALKQGTGPNSLQSMTLKQEREEISQRLREIDNLMADSETL